MANKKIAPAAPITDSIPPTPAKATKAKVPAAKPVPVVEVKVEPNTEPETEVETEAPAEAVTDTPMQILEEKLSLLTALFKEVNAQVRVVKKDMDRLRRIADRVEKKKANAKSQPNGFCRPCLISDELCTFLEVPFGSEKSRTDVTRALHTYVKANDLSDPTNKRIILAHKDPKLKAILNSTDDITISYFNLQKYLKHHFVKPAVPVV
jgi:chromatin remodeling complex protein RSC6